MPYKDLATQRKAHKRWYRENREKRLITLKAWRDANREKMRELSMRWKKEHPEKMKEYQAASRARHPETARSYYLRRKTGMTPEQIAHRNMVRRKYRAEHADEIRAKEKQAYWSNANERMARRLRHRLYDALRDGYKTGSAIDALGCSIEDLRRHIEGLWARGMSWQNYCQFGWHIDHKIPLSSFDLSDPEQLKAACHYTNLQPMWWKDNLIKQAKL